jgi:serine protease Do
MSLEDGRKRAEKLKQWIKTPVGYLSIAFAAALFSVLLYASAQYFYQRTSGAPAEPVAALDNPLRAETENTAEKGLLKRSAESFRNVAKKIGPAVVSIKSTKRVENQFRGRGGRRNMPQGPQGPQGEMDPFFEFFERFGHPFPGQQGPEQPQVGLGSGILIDKRGYVVTNNHVIEGATEVVVSFDGDKTDHKAKIVGADPKTDLAVLKVDDVKNLPTPAEWADTDSVEVGDWAIAIGSPFALGQSVTVGIISAKGGRNSLALTGAEYGGDLLQTDAAINPGNSGGPLCDIEGRVMGVNTAIYTRSGGYMGIGFAIPSSLAKEVVGTLISEGKIIRGWLGVFIQPLEPELAKELGISAGVGVHEVIAGGPAAAAGLQAGDVVIEVDGKPINEVNQLQREIGRHKPGQTVKLKVVGYNDKKTRTISVKVGELPAEGPQARGGGAPRGDLGEPDKAGIVVAPTRKGEGVVVEMVQPGSPAEESGLEPGDIITQVNRKKTNSVDAYRKAVGNSSRLYLEVLRKGRRLFFQFSIR